MLNVAKNEIKDSGARFLALLIYETCTLKSLIVHDNRILGRGGAEIAKAIQETNDL